MTNPPNMERQVHKACGDINAALNEALEALARLSLNQADAFGVARVQTALYRAREANHLLGQMVGTPIERRLPWAYYRARLEDKALRHLSLHAERGRPAPEGQRPGLTGPSGTSRSQACCNATFLELGANNDHQLPIRRR
ncbi:hypothetical protein I553_6518 [Mycobacterium xenopi 4042]|uniref:Uncharacterized protein n=1 Tax=Mycobacterium xenopi 4042 TaxID=1299334 RepID=X8BHD9_MYCXE|nr:hypothetical protein I553_6518 [Mycobacterium xenopi 4042]